MTDKIIVILGPTASGKTALSIKLAKKFHGEIVSADSRQVYRGLDIGSGKVKRKETNGISHYLLNVANPKRRFTVTHFQKLAKKAIKKIRKKGKLPFLVGGTGFYIQSVVDGIVIPNVKPNAKLRKKLENKSPDSLFLMLKRLDPERTKTIDAKNKRRIIRAIEISLSTKKPIQQLKKEVQFDALEIGIKKSAQQLNKLIRKRLITRLNEGMITEVRRLRRQGLSWKRLEELGLEYRYVAQYLQEKITYQEMMAKIQKDSGNFAKRQMTWFKRDKRIHWVKSKKQAEKLVKSFLN